MIPLVLDPAAVTVGLVGRGAGALRRLAWLRAGGMEPMVFSDDPSAELAAAAGASLQGRLPADGDWERLNVVWIVDLDAPDAEALATAARAARVLVNVEDHRPGCDFHTPALVRRGDLMLTVSTNGLSPGLAARIRKQLEEAYGEEWAERLAVLSRKRGAWKRRPRSLDELSRLTDATIDSRGWLDRGAAA